MISRRVLFIGAFVVLGAAAVPVEAADIRGRVIWEGTPPSAERFTAKAKGGSAPVEGCGHADKESPRLRVGSAGGVRDVVVWIETPAGAAAGSRGSVLLDQRECEFVPHVVALGPDSELSIRNSDGVIHSVRIFREGQPSFLMNRWQRVKGPEIRWKFREPGRYLVRCGVHLWMYAWVLALPPAFSTATGESGDFLLSNVPPGRHQLHLWHESVGEWEQPVEVAAGGAEVGRIPMPALKKE